MITSNIPETLRSHEKKIADLEAKIAKLEKAMQSQTIIKQPKINRYTHEEKRRLIINHLHSAPDYANNIARKINISPQALNPVFRELRHDGTITIDHATLLLKFFKLTQKGENEWKQNQF